MSSNPVSRTNEYLPDSSVYTLPTTGSGCGSGSEDEELAAVLVPSPLSPLSELDDDGDEGGGGTKVESSSSSELPRSAAIHSAQGNDNVAGGGDPGGPGGGVPAQRRLRRQHRRFLNLGLGKLPSLLSEAGSSAARWALRAAVTAATSTTILENATRYFLLRNGLRVLGMPGCTAVYCGYCIYTSHWKKVSFS